MVFWNMTFIFSHPVGKKIIPLDRHQEMLEDLPEELLRSVTLAVALGGFGKDRRDWMGGLFLAIPSGYD